MSANFLLGEDTLISTITYRKVFSSGYKYYLTSCCYYYNQYEGGIRQDGAHKKIYYCKQATATDTLLYDFNLSVGDTLPRSYSNVHYPNNYVSSIDSVLVGSSYRKQYHISVVKTAMICPADSNYVQLIEGIGGTFGLFAGLFGSPYCGDNGQYYFNCFSANDTIRYIYPNIFTSDSMTNLCFSPLSIQDYSNSLTPFIISPNPSTGIFTITSSEKFQFSVYDVFGREIYRSVNPLINQSTTVDFTSYPKGIYFVRGKAKDKMFARKIILQ